jgi:RND superfamily putative drug exporter
VVLTLTLGSVRAAGIPLLTAVVGVALAMALVFAATSVVELSATAPLLAVMIGIAVGIDYALFVLARHREQLAEGMDPEESTGRAVATAGSAVVFAGLTVMIALTGLAVARIPFLTVMGLAAAVAVAVAVLVALTLLPAVMGAFGTRLAPRVRARRPGRRPARPTGSAAAAWVRLVTRRPLVTVLVVTAALLTAAVPVLDLRLALPDAGTTAQGTPSRDTYDLLGEEFGPGFNGPLIVTGDIVASTDPLGLVDAVRADIEAMDGVAAVPLATPNPSADTMVLQVVPDGGPTSEETRALVQELRDLRPALEAEHGVSIAVTGTTAVGIDVSDRLLGALLPFVLLVVGLSLVLLAMVFRSVWVPVKAAVGYLLSIGAALGAVVAVYQWGWLEGPLHTVDTGPVVSFMPILVLGILFGLAMDYEVFLVSRIREHHVHGADARTAVRTGFSSAATVVTAAAVIMFAVFAVFVPEGDATLQPIALGLAVGVFVDAFLVRMTLVPAVLTLLGERAWWLPRWLDRLLPSLDVEGEGIAHQLRLQDWPHPGAGTGAYAAGVTVVDAARGGERVLLAPTSLAVPPGHLLLVEGADRVARTALALVLSGRTRPGAGDVKVAGLVLPQQAVAARRAVGLVRAVEEVDPVAAVAHLVAGRHPVPVLVLEGLEAVPGASVRQEALDLLAAACRDSGTAVLLTCDTACADALVVPDDVPARRLVLGPASPEAPEAPEAPGAPVGWPSDEPSTAPEPTPSLVGGTRP